MKYCRCNGELSLKTIQRRLLLSLVAKSVFCYTDFDVSALIYLQTIACVSAASNFCLELGGMFICVPGNNGAA
jgi:hypothetical protein